jgi:phosphoribosylamine--glycine ligase
MKILVIGSGGREHALVWALRKSHRDQLELFCAPGNAGIAQIAECVEIDPTDTPRLIEFAAERDIDLTIVGSEAPLAAGIVDAFAQHNLRIAGPSRDAARLESSKAFAKDFMARHDIPTAHYRIADSVGDAQKILRSGEFGGEDGSYVIKADGLAGGKGVIVARSQSEAASAINVLMEGRLVAPAAVRRVVIEEALVGVEASLLLFADGRDYALMPAARDHKRVGEKDTGPNTGGMGAITDTSVLDQQTLTKLTREVVEPTLNGARSEGFPFRGVLFLGLMLTADGPRVLEYNVRLGDPEAQAILVRLETDLVKVFEAIADGTLGNLSVRWSDDSSACVVLASQGYPSRPETGVRISGLDVASHHEGVEIFHAGTSRAQNGDWLTAGGRVLGVTSTAQTLGLALRRCYDAVKDIGWDGMHYRRDIGKFARETAT